MIDDADGLRLSRYLAGECPAEEAEEIRAWIAADPERARLAAELDQVWRATAQPAAPRDEDAAWRELVAAREAQRVRPLRVPGAEQVPAQDAPAPRWRGMRVRSAWRAQIAAALVVAGLGGALWQLVLRDLPRTEIRSEPAREYATRRGERAEFRLRDGSRVILGVESKLRVPADFGSRTREVHLEGEAFFEVRHDEERPFLVHAANAVAEDLGTEFVVRAYPGEPGARVVVAEGLVALRSSAAPQSTGTALSPGDLGRLDASGIVTVASGVNVNGYLAWTRGLLEFDQRPLRDVIPELERWYDLTVELGDTSLASVPVTVSFGQESADQAVEVLARLLGVEYRRSGALVRFGTK